MNRTVKVIVVSAITILGIGVASIVFLVYIAVNYFQGLELARQGYEEVSQQQYGQAIAHFEAALKKPLDSYQRSYVYLNRAGAYHHQKRFAEAIHDDTEALRLNPKLTFAYEARAWAYHEKGEIDKELADLNEALRQPSNSEYAHSARGMILFDRKDYDRALADFHEAVRCNPANAQFVLMRARCYLAKGELDSALADLDAAIMMDPWNAHNYKQRAEVYQRKGDKDKSARDIAQATQLNRPAQLGAPDASDNLRFLMRQAHAAYDAREFDRAIKIENEAIATNLTPEWASMFLMDRGTAYSAKGDKAKAISDYNEAIRLNPKNAGAFVNRARLTGRDGRYAEAIRDYDEAIRLNPSQWQAYYNRADDHEESGDTMKALADLDKVTAINPTFAPAYLRRADIHILRHETEEAIHDCDSAMSIDPMSAGAYRTRASAHVHKKDYKNALHDFQTATGLETKYPENALNTLAWFCATCPDPSVRDGSKAVAHATKACELTKWQRWHIIDTLAAACAEAGDFDQAIKYQNRAIKMAMDAPASTRERMKKRLALYQKHQPYREHEPE